ncbi:MAG: TIGR03435 family protein, partial [Terriglobales bacterium]
MLAAMLIAPLWTAWGPKLSLIRFARPAQPSTTVSAPLAPNAAAEAAWTAHQRTPAEILPAAARAPAPHRPWLPLALAVLYLAGAVVLLLRLLVGSVRAVRLARLGEGAAVAAPVTIGWFRPSILLPAAAHAWPQEQLACVLAHERAHARRRDPLVQWLALLNRALLWFHPLAWWLERKLASLAEEACDAAVVSAGHDPQSYSELLLRMARGIAHGGGRLVAAMPMPGGFLSRRVRSILDPAPPRVSRLRLAAFALIAAPAVVLALAAVQSVPPAQPDAIIDAAALPHFDVAALKPTDPNVRYRGLRQISAGGRIVYSAYTLHDLLHDAFGVERYQIAGGPDWTDTQNWDIEAKPPEGSPAASFIPRNPKVTPPPDELLMLRALLIERFPLRLALE